MVILIQCKDRVGLVAAIAGILARRSINIISMREHVDTLANQFFLRLVTSQHESPDELFEELKTVLPPEAHISVNPEPEKKIILFVTKEYHCLSDILVRNHFKTLGASVLCVIGNHPDMEDVCQRFDVPFFLVSHEHKTKAAFESELVAIVNRHNIDYLVLAKFMRILSPEFISLFPLKILNIHHSFLPAFIGANPYKQAYLRGVKLIGATAHFVTNNLDEGPIIEQQIITINHTYTTYDMVRAGKEIETAVLARALKLVFEDRVFIYDNKTVVFE
jgi:formyltetrahydrofolate deformylase